MRCLPPCLQALARYWMAANSPPCRFQPLLVPSGKLLRYCTSTPVRRLPVNKSTRMFDFQFSRFCTASGAPAAVPEKRVLATAGKRKWRSRSSAVANESARATGATQQQIRRLQIGAANRASHLSYSCGYPFFDAVQPEAPPCRPRVRVSSAPTCAMRKPHPSRACPRGALVPNWRFAEAARRGSSARPAWPRV